MDSKVQKECRQCGKTLVGRLDKQFCDSQCRNTYNNKNKRDDQLLIQEVNRLIRKNRRILKSLCPVGKAVVRKEVLDALDYNYRYFSSIYKSPKNQVYYVSYDYAFSPIKEVDRATGQRIKKALIVQKQSYFDVLTIKLWR